nr:glycosyltransferase [Arthrobacter sp. SF27]
MVGQLNERIDFDVLEALQASGTPIEVVGPRTERDPETSDRLDRFLAAKNVTWLGQLSQSEVALFLEEVGVGLTPYNDSDFNRSSFPLKTLEYLAHGAPVVATDLPAVRWLDTDLVEIASGTTEFVRSVQSALSAPDTAVTHDMRRQFARQHSWDARAAQMLELIRRSNS